MKRILLLALTLISVNLSSADKSDQKTQKEFVFLFENELRLYNSNNSCGKHRIILQKKDVDNKSYKVPEAKFKDYTSGKSFSLADFAGKTVVFGIFEKKYQFLWELRLLDKIQKIFPENPIVILGFIGLNELEIKNIIEKNKLKFIVTDAEEIYKNWPDNFHTEKKSKNTTYNDLINTNFVINSKGLVQGYFKEIIPDYIKDLNLSAQDLIEKEIRPYFENNLDITSVKLPLTLVDAVRINDIQSCKKLIKNGEEINNYENSFTALHYAVKNNNIKIAELLLENGADISLRENNIKYYDSPFEMAAKNSSKEMINLLAKSVKNEKELSEYCGKAMVELIRYFNNFEIAEYLIKNYIKDNKERSLYCGMALKYAIEKNRLEFIKLLIQNKADINYGHPLVESVKSDERLEITKLLIENGANIFVSDNNGNTPYRIAKTGSQNKTSDYLENIYKIKEKETGNLVILAKEKLDYKAILKLGFKPKLSPDYKFPATQQGKLDCYGFTVKHLIQYKYNETIDVDKFNKKYGEAWISMHENEFAEENNLKTDSFTSMNLFFYHLIIGEPVIINYLYTYKNGSTIRHYAVAYSFDDTGVWLADSAGGKRHRKSYDFLLEGGTEIWFEIIRKK